MSIDVEMGRPSDDDFGAQDQDYRELWPVKMTQLLSDFAFSKSETDKNLKLQGHFNQKHENLQM